MRSARPRRRSARSHRIAAVTPERYRFSELGIALILGADAQRLYRLSRLRDGRSDAARRVAPDAGQPHPAGIARRDGPAAWASRGARRRRRALYLCRIAKRSEAVGKGSLRPRRAARRQGRDPGRQPPGMGHRRFRDHAARRRPRGGQHLGDGARVRIRDAAFRCRTADHGRPLSEVRLPRLSRRDRAARRAAAATARGGLPGIADAARLPLLCRGRKARRGGLRCGARRDRGDARGHRLPPLYVRLDRGAEGRAAAALRADREHVEHRPAHAHHRA